MNIPARYRTGYLGDIGVTLVSFKVWTDQVSWGCPYRRFFWDLHAGTGRWPEGIESEHACLSRRADQKKRGKVDLILTARY
jgi:hypothetical protein